RAFAVDALATLAIAAPRLRFSLLPTRARIALAIFFAFVLAGAVRRLRFERIVAFTRFRSAGAGEVTQVHRRARLHLAGLAYAAFARVVRRACVVVAARSSVCFRVIALARALVARACVMALILGGACHGIASDTSAGIARVGLCALVVVVARFSGERRAFAV